MIKTRTWIVIIACSAAVLAVLSALLLSQHRGGNTVEIVQDGTVIKEIDLSKVTREYSFTVEWKDGGYNVVRVVPGRICVYEADCPDQICVNQGWLTDQAAPIVCMPHRLIIRAKAASDADAVTQ